MFLNKTIFKKWIRNAYCHGGLTVGMIYGGLVLSAKGWITWTKDGAVPNWVKAAVMEHTGELPGRERVFKAQKNELLQYEISDNGCFDLPERFLEAREAFTVTPITYAPGYTAYRLLQSRATKRIILLPEDYYSIIDLSELGEENPPMGPSCKSAIEGSFMMWKNENSALAVSSMEGGYDKHEIGKLLQEVDFGKEDY